MLGGTSYDALSADVAGLSDQCVAVELPLDTTVRVYQFGENSANTTGLREEFWLLWIPLGTDPDNAGNYFSIQWAAAPSPSPTVLELTPGTTKQPFGMAPLGLPWFKVRVPRGKPYGFYRSSFSVGEIPIALRGVRIWPPAPPPSK